MDASEFKQLYQGNARKLYNFILWTTGNRSACDDILQTVFMKVWRRGNLPPSPEEQTAWLFAVARNACIDYFRSIKKHAEYNDRIPTDESSGVSIDEGSAAWRQVALLEENERAVIYLHLKLGYTYAEIGHLLGVTESSVRVKAFRTFRKLRDILIRKGL